jgi:hypothetical protein
MSSRVAYLRFREGSAAETLAIDATTLAVGGTNMLPAELAQRFFTGCLFYFELRDSHR